MVAIAGERALFRRDRRRALCHTRQIAMYVCHVALQIPQGDGFICQSLWIATGVAVVPAVGWLTH